MAEPRWLSRLVVDAVHFDQLREHGGHRGIRDEKALESALARARSRREYARSSDLARLAAAYGIGIVTSHPYRNGNKRIGFLAMVIFLGLNGKRFSAPESDVVTTMVALADRRLSEDQLAEWLRGYIVT
jgi:death-on-curing protein